MPAQPAPPARSTPVVHWFVALSLAVGIAVALLPLGRWAPVAAEPPAAGRAVDWLEGELVADGGALSHLGRTDWGVTTDVLLAAIAAGRAADATIGDTVAAAIAHLDDYSTWNDLGPAYSGVRLAGPLAKITLLSLLAGRPATVVGPLEAELRALVDPAGRFADRNPHGPDSSNGFGQALGILALARTPGGVPASAVEYLLGQQCPGGGFRLSYSASACTDAGAADPDATAMAVQALLVVPTSDAVSGALDAAATWLLSVQRPDGSVGGAGPTAAPNANSTGLAAQALRALGATEAADLAAGWVRSLQRPAGGPDAGAIAYDPVAWTDAAAGIGALARDQWRRATSQGVLALGLPPFGAVPPAGEDGPGAATTTTSATTTSAVAPSTTTTTSTTTIAATTTTSASVPSTTTTSRAPERAEPVEVAGRVALRRSRAVDAQLPATGADVSGPLRAALVLLLVGALLLAGRRSRT